MNPLFNLGENLPARRTRERERERGEGVRGEGVHAEREREQSREEGRERKVRDGEKMDKYVCVYI